ncbi:MAG: site-specific integrase [Rikenellaceae bacterium]
MERKLFSVLFFVKKSRVLKNGESPIIVRITYGGQVTEFQSGRTTPINQWSQTKGCVIGKDRKTNEVNNFIEMVRLKIYQIQQEFERTGELYTVNTIRDTFRGNGPKSRTIYSVFKEHNEKCRALIGIDYELITIRRYDNCLKYLLATIKKQYGKEDILLSEINGELVRNFEFYLKTERGCAQNTVIRYMKCFKKITNLAIANEWMSRDPFAGIKFHEQKVVKEFLTQAEIARLVQKEFDSPRLDLVRDIFVFCIFSGLAFVDVLNLRPEHITTDHNGKQWIRKARQKTDVMCNIPLLQIPQIILEKYKDHPKCQTKGVLLPVMPNQNMNNYLKEIAAICQINKRLTTHTARHSFASSVALANKVSLSNVAKMMGHTTTRMTQHYAKVMDSSIMEDMECVEDNFADMAKAL